MRTRAPWRLLAALLTLTLVAAACGDDETTTAGSDTDAVADGDATTDGDGDDLSDGHEDDGHEAEDHDHDDGHGDPIDGDVDGGDMGDDMSHGDDGHDHGEAVEFTGDAAPTVDVEVDADPAGGINVHVTTTDYTVNAAAASTEHVEGEGHFHLYLDGEKVLRFYNESIHVAGVAAGEVEVAVELSANDHRSYAVDGEPLVARTVFTVPEHSHDGHSHDDPAPVEWEGSDVSLAIEVRDDPKSGWNAFVTVEGLEFSAANVNDGHVPGEGHLHLYANGQKLGRLYGPATHIAALPDGEVEISVVAYTNDHAPYVVDGVPVEAATTVTVTP